MNFDDIKFDLDDVFAKLRQRAKWMAVGGVIVAVLTKVF